MRRRAKPHSAVIRRLARTRKQITRRSVAVAKRNWRAIGLVAIMLAVVLLPKLSQPTELQVKTDRLLSTIAKGESRGNYNAYYGNVANDKIRFTEMPVRKVLAWQDAFVKKGSPSSAVGKYQFIKPTLQGLIKELSIHPDVKFDAALQDRLAARLLERRGLHEYMQGKMSREEFAHNLSKEWAALPKIIGSQPDQSYYAGDGLNKAQISRSEIFSSIATLQYQPSK